MSPEPSGPPAGQARVAWWRNERVLRVLAQVVFLLAVIAVAGLLYANVRSQLRARGLTTGYGFLYGQAGFPIGEGIEYHEGDPYWYAFLVGVVNTIRVSFFGIVLATILGTFTGIARLSSNWLLSKLAGAYIEIIRNIPLLIQLVFWYFAVILQLPGVKESVVLPGLVLAPLLWRWRMRRQELTGQPGRGLAWAGGALFGLPALGWLVAGQPLLIELPEIGGFNYAGGLILTPEFTAVLIGLTVYTAAFIAEVVRAGIQAVHVGQKEAARALGFHPGQTLRLIILPQSVRVIIPPLISQYLNLAKNSSLAVAAGFPDLFSVAQTIFNQTGRSVEVIGMVMGSYLAMSLFTSLVLNLYNRRVRLVER